MVELCAQDILHHNIGVHHRRDDEGVCENTRTREGVEARCVLQPWYNSCHSAGQPHF